MSYASTELSVTKQNLHIDERLHFLVLLKYRIAQKAEISSKVHSLYILLGFFHIFLSPVSAFLLVRPVQWEQPYSLAGLGFRVGLRDLTMCMDAWVGELIVRTCSSVYHKIPVHLRKIVFDISVCKPGIQVKGLLCEE